MSVAAVKGQCLSLLQSLEVLGPSTAAAAWRRSWAQVREQRWMKDRHATLLSERQGRSIVHRGFAKMDYISLSNHLYTENVVYRMDCHQ